MKTNKWNLVVGGVVAIVVLMMVRKYFLQTEGLSFQFLGNVNQACPTGTARFVGEGTNDGQYYKDVACIKKGDYANQGGFVYYSKCTFRAQPGVTIKGYWGNYFTDELFTVNPGGTKSGECKLNSIKVY
jgi:hypothetical protein